MDGLRKKRGEVMSVIDILKPHNLEAFEEINKMLESGKKKIAVPRATGSGKTFLMGALAEKYSSDKKIVLEPTKPLLDSIKEKFDEFSIENTDFITYQKLIRMSDEDIAEMDYKLIFLDECHHGTAPKWGQKIRHLMETHSDSIICGTSATTVRNDGVNVVESLFENNSIEEFPLSMAIARKVLPCPHYITAIYRLDDEFEKLKKRIEASTNTKEEKREFYEKMKIMQSHFEKSYGIPTILNKYIKVKNGRYLVFCKDKKHLDSMRDIVIDWFKTAGIKDIHSYAVFSDYPDKEKDYKEFCADISNSAKILFSINMLNEGLHIKDISGVLMLRTTQSHLIYLQQLGRLVDADNIDKYLLVFDFVNNFSRVNDGIGLLREIKDAVAKEKESDPDFNDDGFEDIDTFFVLEQVVEIQEMFREIEGRLGGREWSEEEIEILKKWYPIEGTRVMDRLRGRTKSAIHSIVSKLGIKAPDIQWTELEIEILKRLYPQYGIKTKKFLPNRPIFSIRDKANELGLYVERISIFSAEEDEIIKQYYPLEGSDIYKRLNGKTKKQCRSRAKILNISFIDNGKWTEEEDDIIRKYYASDSEIVIKKLENRSKNQILQRASLLKVRRKSLDWTLDEDNTIRKYYQSEKAEIVKRLKGRSRDACVTRARILGVSEKGERIPWTEEDYKVLKEYYPIIGNEVSILLNRSKGACMAKASKLGIARNKNKYKYVHKCGNKYAVQFYVNGRIMRFGSFDSEEEAAKVAMQKAKEYGKAI